LVFVFLEEVKLTATTQSRLDRMNQQFRNLFVIFIGSIEPEDWYSLQFVVDNYSGGMKFLRADDYQSTSKLTLQVLGVMKNQEKLKLQELYFENEKRHLASAATARKVIREAFGALEIPLADIRIIEDGLPTLANVITATREALIENSPASYDTILKITSMFDS
jgi:hypothetical protein